MEIVSEPDLRSAEEAGAYLRKLRSILRYLGTCDGNMEEGSLRCDCNVSVRKPGAPLGTRCEIKNVNSVRFVMQAIEYRGAPPDRDHRGGRHDRPGDAALRYRRAARPGRCAPRKTRTTTAISPTPTCCRWCSTRPGSSELQRRACRNCPTRRRRASSRDYGLSAEDAGVLVAEHATADFFETVAKGRDAEGWRPTGSSAICSARSTSKALGIEESPVAAARARRADRSHRRRHDLRPHRQGCLRRDGRDRRATRRRSSRRKGLRQVTDTGAIEAAVDAALAANPAQVAEYAAARTSCSASSSAR